MLVSINWLKNYIDIGSIQPEELAELITKSGIEVDGIYTVAKESTGVVVGYVETCEQHPNADKLKLCQVDVGDEQLQIICGAPNVAVGQKVAVAKPGAVLPGNFKIKKVKLRGVESNGMICSLQELGIEEKYVPADVAEGIFVFPEDTEVGTDVTSLLNLDDVILEFDLTPNRADCLSMIGVAYEISAILNKPITLPKPSVETIAENSKDYVSVEVEDPQLAPMYAAFMIKDVNIKQSPLWMRNYLMAAGIRPINNVVDITNYVLIEYGQPLHAFDFDRLNSNQILVRCARENETIVTLDEQERTLSEDHLLITNGKEPVALAGVMGGANTEVTNETSTILLEAAYFDPQTVRKAVQHTGLRSEASTRFEKGVDPKRVYEAGLRACQLLAKYADGKVLMDAAVFDSMDMKEETVNITLEEINQRLGTEISTEELKAILQKLQFTFEKNNDDYHVTVPTRRSDIRIFEDMLEEVARIYGYDRLPYTLPGNASKPGGLSERQQLKRNIKSYMQSTGLSEAITYSLTSKDDVRVLVAPEIEEDIKPIELAMPMSEDHRYLRLSLLPELLNRLSYNVARKQMNVGLYEVGSIFLSSESTLTKQPKEHVRLSGALTGTWLNHPWQQEVKKVDFYVIKGIVEGLFNYLNMDVTFEQSVIDHMHPGRCAAIKHGNQSIGFLGQVHPLVAKTKDLKEVYVFDIDMEYILDTYQTDLAYTPVPKYPSILRDIAFVVDQEVLAGDIKKEIEVTGTPLVKYVEAFDVYTGENIDEHKKSIAFNVHFLDPEKTLTDEEVDELFEKIVEGVIGKFGAYIRK